MQVLFTLSARKGVKKMRLIDADKLMKAMMTACLKEMDVDSPIKGMSIVLDRIYNAPIVDAVQMERGGRNEIN